MRVFTKLILFLVLALSISNLAFTETTDDEELLVEDEKPEDLSEAELKKKMEKDLGVREGIDKVMTMEDMMSAFGGQGGEKAEAEPVKELQYEEISGTTSFVQPVPYSTLNTTFVDVQLNIATNSPNTTAFTGKFNHSSICLSMDESEFSCWPIFGLSRFPRFAGVPPGNHTIVAKLVDPDSGLFIEESTSNCTFTVVKPNVTEEVPNNAVAKPEDNAESSQQEDDEEKETVEIPVVDVTFPTEGSATVPTFEVRLQISTSTNLTRFKKLFNHSFMCLSLDESPHTCWPVFEERYFPKFSNVKAGQHTLTAELSHPNNGDLIRGTSLGIRNFWVNDKVNEGLVPMTLVDPSEGSTAFSEEMKNSNVVEEMQTNEDPDETRAIEALPTTSEKTEVVLNIAVNGKSKALPVHKDDDYEMKATDFCYSNAIQESSCVDQIVKQINLEWDKKPQLSF